MNMKASKSYNDIFHRVYWEFGGLKDSGWCREAWINQIKWEGGYDTGASKQVFL